MRWGGCGDALMKSKGFENQNFLRKQGLTALVYQTLQVYFAERGEKPRHESRVSLRTPPWLELPRNLNHAGWSFQLVIISSSCFSIGNRSKDLPAVLHVLVSFESVSKNVEAIMFYHSAAKYLHVVGSSSHPDYPTYYPNKTFCRDNVSVKSFIVCSK
jgi:hypothetical protein